jgi:hypothetical protein
VSGEPARQQQARPAPAPGAPAPQGRTSDGPVSEGPVSEDPASEGLASQSPASEGAVSPGPVRQQPSALRRLCAIVLIMETIVIWLSIPVALAVDHASPSRAGVAGVALALVAVALAAAARRRPRLTIVGGSVLQALVIASGAIVPVMYFLGAIFAALWIIGIALGRRLDAAP